MTDLVNISLDSKDEDEDEDENENENENDFYIKKNLIKENNDIKYLFLYILILGILIIFEIIYISLGIYFLIKYIDNRNKCNNNYIWIYNLISIIFSFTNFIINVNKKISSNFLFFFYLIYICLTIIGCIELFYLICNNLKHTPLYNFGICSFIIQIITIFFYCYLKIFYSK